MLSIFNGELLKAAPAQYISKPDAIKYLGLLCEGMGDVALIVHDSDLPPSIIDNLSAIVSKSHIIPMVYPFSDYSTIAASDKIIRLIHEGSVGFVIAVGGGRCIDTAKLAAYKTHKKLVTVPTSAATCAAWAANVNLYSDEGAYQKSIPISRCPELLLLDLNLCAGAPARYIASGLLDAAAKYYESEATVHGEVDTASHTALMVARSIHEGIFPIARKAYSDAKEGQVSAEYYRAIEISILQAGLVGGLGGAKIRTAAAHAIHHAMTRIPATWKALHGEKVGFGILAQLILTKKPEPMIQEYLRLASDLEVELSLDKMGLSKNDIETLRVIADFACNPNSAIHKMKLDIVPDMVIAAMLEADEVWAAYSHV